MNRFIYDHGVKFIYIGPPRYTFLLDAKQGRMYRRWEALNLYARIEPWGA